MKTHNPLVTQPTTESAGDWCDWCESTEDVLALSNGWDFDPLRDDDIPTISLCAGCRREVGISSVEPDACAQHRAGCGAGSHAARERVA